MQLENNTFFNLLDNRVTSPDIAENKDIPSLQVVLPDKTLDRNVSVIVIPGGGYTFLAPHETQPVADWLCKAGYTCFILRYRLAPNYFYPVPYQDVQRAIRLVRLLSQDGLLASSKVGVIGFSAGGHLVSTVSNHFLPGGASLSQKGEVSLRPDFQILVYPLISLVNRTPDRHYNVFGPNPKPEDVELLSNEKQVSGQTPPAFVFHSTKDEVVPVLHSDLYTESLQKAGVPYTYVRGEYGGHGIAVHPFWTDACLDWLENISQSLSPQIAHKSS